MEHFARIGINDVEDLVILDRSLARELHELADAIGLDSFQEDHPARRLHKRVLLQNLKNWFQQRRRPQNEAGPAQPPLPEQPNRLQPLPADQQLFPRDLQQEELAVQHDAPNQVHREQQMPDPNNPVVVDLDPVNAQANFVVPEQPVLPQAEQQPRHVPMQDQANPVARQFIPVPANGQFIPAVQQLPAPMQAHVNHPAQQQAPAFMNALFVPAAQQFVPAPMQAQFQPVVQQQEPIQANILHNQFNPILSFSSCRRSILQRR
jgi:hypothetical protein